MESENFSLFIDALNEVFSEIGLNTVIVEKFDGSGLKYDLIGSVGIAGQYRGYIMIKFFKENAKTLVNNIIKLMDMENSIENYEIFYKEAIAELINQISGRIVMFLSEQDIECNITPPTLFSGSNIFSNMLNPDINISKRIKGEFGEFDFYVDIKKI